VGTLTDILQTIYRLRGDSIIVTQYKELYRISSDLTLRMREALAEQRGTDNEEFWGRTRWLTARGLL